MFIGRQPLGSGRRIDRRAMRAEAAAIFARLGVPLDPARIARGLSIADQQVVEIGKAISLRARVIVMDEPTAALSAAEVDRLFDVIRTLRAAGTAVLFISHRLEEVFALCQRVTVMRDGRQVLSPRARRADRRATWSARWWAGNWPNGRPGSRPRRASRCSPWTGSPARACSPTSRSASAPGRSSRWPGWSARGAARWPGRSSASTATTPARSPCAGGGCAAARPPGRWPPAWGSCPRTGGSRGWSWTCRCQQNVALASLGRLRRGGLIRASAERALAADWGARLDDQVRQAQGPGVDALRRQPAEGRAGQVAGPQARGADRGRAHPGHRRGHQGRGPPPAGPARAATASAC